MRLWLVALLLVTACERHGAAGDDSRPQISGQTVTFAAGSAAAKRLQVEAATEPMERELTLPGRLVWDEDRTVRVFAPFSGRVTRIIAAAGQRVAAGQALAEFASSDFGQAQSDARKAKADLALADRSLQRATELNAHGVLSQKELQQAQTDQLKARAEADRALGRLRPYGADLEDATVFTLRSPVAGTVVERNLNPGQEVRVDQPGAPLFVVSDPTRLWISLDASEGDLPYLKPGLAIVLSSNQFADDAFAAELVQLPDFVDPASRTLKLRGVVPNADRRLKAEMFVTARLRLPRDDHPTVSARAVYLSGARHFVFVRTDDHTFVRRAVRVGPESGGRMPVLSGLASGELVVVAGNLLLEGMLAAARSDAADEKTARK